jgi:hypothetical protein
VSNLERPQPQKSIEKKETPRFKKESASTSPSSLSSKRVGHSSYLTQSFFESFFRSQLLTKSVDSSFTNNNVNNTPTDLCGNGLGAWGFATRLHPELP